MLVVGYHAKILALTGGFIGVDVFFVISGYLITSLIAMELESTNAFSFSGFYLRRIKRLLPALLVMVFLILILWEAVAPGSRNDIGEFAKSIRFAFSGLANFYFLNHTGGYFDSAANQKPMLHTWSLSVEEQFYLFWPAVLFLIKKCTIHFDHQARLKPILTAACTFMVLGSFALSTHLLNGGEPPQAFYLTAPRAWELLVGALAFLYQKPDQKNANDFKLETFISILGLSAILIPAFCFGDTTPFPGWHAGIPVLGTAVLVFFRKQNFINKILSGRILVFIGLRSYSLYL